jgi:hypothetical protein
VQGGKQKPRRSWTLRGFPFGGRGWEVGLAHAALGGLSMACAVLLPCDDDGSATR